MEKNLSSVFAISIGTGKLLVACAFEGGSKISRGNPTDEEERQNQSSRCRER